MKKTIEHNFDYQVFLKYFFLFLLGIELFILLADILLNFHQWIGSRALRRAFNITREDSLSNWFSSLQAFFVGLVVLVIYLSDKTKDNIRNKGWLVISSFFIYIAIDDAIKLHERIGTAFKNNSPNFLANYPSYSWQLILGPIFIIMGCFIFYFLWNKMKKQRHLVVLAICLFAFAVFLDFLEGQKNSIYIPLADVFASHQSILLHYAKAIEETIEMLATSIFLISFLRFFFEKWNSVKLHWQKN